MKKLIIPLASVLLMAVVGAGAWFASNGFGSRFDIRLERLMDEESGYAYKGMSWGMDKAGVEEVLGFTLENPGPNKIPFTGEGNESIYVDDSARVSLNVGGRDRTYDGAMRAGFEDGALYIIVARFEIERDDPAAVYEGLVGSLTGIYGEPDKYSFLDKASGSRPLKYDITSHRWYRFDGDRSIILSAILESGAEGDSGGILSISVEEFKGDRSVLQVITD